MGEDVLLHVDFAKAVGLVCVGWLTVHIDEVVVDVFLLPRDIG